MGDNEIIDLDAIKPKGKKFKIGGKVIEIDFIPFEVTLDIAEHYDEFMKLGDGKTDGTGMRTVMDTMYKAVIKILNRADKEITEEWVKDNISGQQMTILIQKLMTPMVEQFGEGEKKT